MNRLTASIAFVLGVCFLAASANGQDGKLPSDADITKMLVGTWRFESGPKDPPLKLTFTFAMDQTFSGEGESRDLNNVRHETKATGTWKVDKGEVISIMKTSTNPKDVGKETRTRVISIDAATAKIAVTFKGPGPKNSEKTVELHEVVFEYKKVK